MSVPMYSAVMKKNNGSEATMRRIIQTSKLTAKDTNEFDNANSHF